MREIIINIEGTGLYPERDDRITEIVYIELVDKKMTGNMFHTFINPNMKVQDKSDEFNEFLKNKPNFKDIVANFLDFIGLGTFYECIKQYYASKDEVKNTFKKITVGDKTITGGNSNTLTIEAGNNIMITPDATNNKMTISSLP